MKKSTTFLTPLHNNMITKKRMIEYFKLWQKTQNKDLISCYKNPTQKKLDAYEYIIQHFYLPDDGFSIKIIAYNSHCFTVGYLFDVIDYNTKIRTVYFKVITKSNIGEILLSETYII